MGYRRVRNAASEASAHVIPEEDDLLVGQIVGSCLIVAGLFLAQEASRAQEEARSSIVQRLIKGPDAGELRQLAVDMQEFPLSERIAFWRVEHGTVALGKPRERAAARRLYRGYIRAVAEAGPIERYHLLVAATGSPLVVYPGPVERSPFQPEQMFEEDAAQAVCERLVIDPRFRNDYVHFLSWCRF